MSKIAFITNFYNHHQKYLSQALLENFGSYSLIATKPISEERLQMGWGQETEPDYVLHVGENDEKIDSIIENASTFILGTSPEEMERRVFSKNAVFFRYSERQLKNGPEIHKYLFRLFRWHRKNPNRKRIYLLAASAYATSDYRKYGLFKNRSYKWGYFPETKRYDNVNELIKNKQKTTILWCGRFLDLKHPEDVILVAEKLKEKNCFFEIKIIGTGEKEGRLRCLVKDKSLDDCVSFLGSMKPEEVRAYMEEAGIYLFTSDRYEGWGAVLNESMNSGCAVVASHAIGSVPFLLQNGENGLIYRSGDVDMLYEKVKFLLDHPDEQARLGANAYRTITDEWNAEVAAMRFKNLTEHIVMGEKYPDLYKSGPCSKAEKLKDDWFNE